MLNMLKADIVKESTNTLLEQSIIDEVNNNDVRDAFLDDVENELIGVENDPKLNKLIQDIPEYDTEDGEDINLESMMESYLDCEV